MVGECAKVAHLCNDQRAGTDGNVCDHCVVRPDALPLRGPALSRFKARHAGVCAMTGVPITPGADVFHPARIRGGAANADAMILTRALRCATADSVCDDE